MTVNRIVKPVPITSKRRFAQLEKNRKEINRLNRQRAKAMEKRVARYLDGTQTPQSGAGSAKGDILIDFINRPGKYMIECKMSSETTDGEASITTYKLWFDKMYKDARAMRALFPILVFHYHNRQGDYVVAPKEGLLKLGITFDETGAFVKTFNTVAKSFKIHARYADTTKKPPYYILLIVNDVVYYCMTLEYFRDIMKEI
jgi:hypothetical protein